MAKREVLGTMACPECGYGAAEIKTQKCGVKLYRFCPECNAQFFARKPEQEQAMRVAVGPEKEAKQEEPAKPVQVEKKAEPAPERRSSLASALQFLGGNA